MTRDEFKNLEIGDMVVITQHGKNKGKTGIVKEMADSTAYLEPFQCEFEFANTSAWRLHKKKGLYGYGSCSINYPKRPHGKEFYIIEMFGGDGVSWSAENFTEKELEVIDRFLNGLNKHVRGLNIEEIVILNSDPDEYLILKGDNK